MVVCGNHEVEIVRLVGRREKMLIPWGQPEETRFWLSVMAKHKEGVSSSWRQLDSRVLGDIPNVLCIDETFSCFSYFFSVVSVLLINSIHICVAYELKDCNWTNITHIRSLSRQWIGQKCVMAVSWGSGFNYLGSDPIHWGKLLVLWLWANQLRCLDFIFMIFKMEYMIAPIPLAVLWELKEKINTRTIAQVIRNDSCYYKQETLWLLPPLKCQAEKIRDILSS